MRTSRAAHGTNGSAIKVFPEAAARLVFSSHGQPCSGAASGGHLECLKYAHEQGCPSDEQTSLAAASGGHLECLK